MKTFSGYIQEKRPEKDRRKQCIGRRTDITHMQSEPETDYGYRKMYFILMLLGYYINNIKAYRLMIENNLLKSKNILSTVGGLCQISYVTQPKGPVEVFEMNIQYVWVTIKK